MQQMLRDRRNGTKACRSVGTTVPEGTLGPATGMIDMIDIGPLTHLGKIVECRLQMYPAQPKSDPV